MTELKNLSPLPLNLGGTPVPATGPAPEEFDWTEMSWENFAGVGSIHTAPSNDRGLMVRVALDADEARRRGLNPYESVLIRPIPDNSRGPHEGVIATRGEAGRWYCSLVLNIRGRCFWVHPNGDEVDASPLEAFAPAAWSGEWLDQHDV